MAVGLIELISHAAPIRMEESALNRVRPHLMTIRPRTAPGLALRVDDAGDPAFQANVSSGQPPPASTSLERVSFPTPDGGLVYADLYGKGDRGVVLAHGARFNKESWEKQARALAEAGFRTLAIDFRGYGQSRGGAQTGARDGGRRFDVLAAVRYLRKTGSKTVSVVGGSMGGDAASGASVESEPGEIDRLILLAHGAFDPPEQIKGRKLFVVSREDPGPGNQPRLVKIREQYEKTPGPKELLILEGAAHAQMIFATEQGERLMREILRFLSAP
jgi:pimeloyl-ACP methyl ester carboxylesterase